jgi:hypothetical protein
MLVGVAAYVCQVMTDADADANQNVAVRGNAPAALPLSIL